ncbi:MAG: pilin [Christensenellaceae bacterium]|jgi:xanthine/uracil permease|nr:pilin [Christensenellaceae bacterium]
MKLTSITSLLAAVDYRNENAMEELKNNLTQLLNNFYPYIIAIVSAFVALWAVFIGLKWWQAGNQEKHREAKEYLKNFIIGLVIIFILAVGATALIGYLGNWANPT